MSRVEGDAVVVATSTTFSELVEGLEGGAPEPRSLGETTIENEGCRATPLQHWRRLQQLLTLCRRKVAKVDGSGCELNLITNES